MTEKTLPDRIQNVPLIDALSERYLAYALSTIMSRSLPDVRDGLKPVHRRLIYAMYQLKLHPDTGFKKCARVVGDVIGKFHPHGDSSVYDALVRLAQDFAVRYPLVEGQGNFGSIDGDNAAAMRYTESRLTEVAQALLLHIDEDAVDFHPTYDGEENEPDVLPAAFPNLLANGASGIAVGMATSIPPHNAAELYKAAIALIEKPDIENHTLTELVPGPDFPTGGIIVEEKEHLRQIYETGKGYLRLRARWEVEQGRFGTWQVVVTEIPYQVQKSRLIEQVADLLEKKRLSLLLDIRDESADEIRLVLEPKNKNVAPDMLMETLFRQTALETRFSVNMNVLNANHVPAVMNLKACLQAWLDHRHSVLLRRSHFRLHAVVRRLEILDGFLAVYLNLDEVIRIIRDSERPKEELIRHFSLTEIQAESILNMRLRSLRKLEELEIKKEHEGLLLEEKSLNKLLKDTKLQWASIGKELKEGLKKFSSEKNPYSARRTGFGAVPTPIDLTVIDDIEKEPITIIITEKEWIKALKGHNLNLENHKFKEGDRLQFQIECETTDRIGIFSSAGKVFSLSAGELPRGRGDGQGIRLLVDLANDETIVTAFPLETGETPYLVASTSGRGFMVQGAILQAEKRTGKQILTLKKEEKAFTCQKATGDQVAILSTRNDLVIFPLEHIPVLTKGVGVILQKMITADDQVKSIRTFDSQKGLQWSEEAPLKTFSELRDFCFKRAAKGRKIPTSWKKWIL
ncbi:DNA topoisomerase IV subunit A [Entomobacter blattae]|uniref:DNA topoisomerase 4 subunit A n=1 Tax=Entomobacter blattae TaxID=2762277 RepID=A0A7H1NT11_9PROT|nr:DNA topoisomerase IV subunit A [Entomobacter blattae]QNT78921.1 DNA topoisomerase 4 subunit A [Entomobacter blattae]